MVKQIVARPVLPVLLLAAAMTVGCTAQGGESWEKDGASTSALSDLPADDPRAPVTEEPVLDSPLQAYRLTATELATVYFAKDVLVQKCMDRFGFDYAPQASFADALHGALVQERWDLSRVHGVSNRAWAEKYGYGLPPVEDDSASEATGVTEAFEFVLRGQRRNPDGTFAAPTMEMQKESPGQVDGQEIPPGGCAGEARRKFGTTDPNISDYGYAHDLWIDGYSKVKASADYRATVAEWSDCLAAEGYRVSDPVDDEGDIAELSARPGAVDSLDYEPPSEREIKLAVADVDCKEKVNLLDRIRDIENEVAEAAIEENQLALEADRKRLDAQVRQAGEIVEKYGA